MKKVLFLAVMAFGFVLAANAKDEKVTVTSGDGKVLLESGKTAVLEIDYQNTTVEGKPLNTYLKGRGEQYVTDWPEIAKVARSRFIKEFNNRNKKGVQIIESGESDLKLKIIVEKLLFGNAAAAVFVGGFGSAGGAEITGNLIVNDQSGKQLAEYKIFEVRGNGSTDFSESKRLGTCYENAAKMIIKTSSKSE